ncbi:hypothetical protein [Pseudonocardia sp. GCM10023141]|uniref:hypothetical protein n=1 Tax=Pseudonocardia sp. GCM10023141 TaxID=3252653 RepID=UPI00361437CC
MDALVLGACGPIGGAWLGGLVAGLIEGGIPLTVADQVVGTSVGAVLGAWLGSGADLAGYFDAMAARAAWLATGARTGPAGFWVDRLPPGPWPAPLRIAVAAADSGRIAVWGRGDGVPLGTALAAATAASGGLPPVLVHGRPYADGADRSPTNADLAASRIDEEGSRVLILAPVVSRRLATEVGLLRGLGCVVAVITPDRGQVVEARGPAGGFGPAFAGPAARAGHEQAVRALTGVPLGATVGRYA